jgi:hypothetical protein
MDGVCDCLDSIHKYNKTSQSCTLVKNSSVTESDLKMTSNKQLAYEMGASKSSPKPYINLLLTVTIIFSWNVFIIL